MYRLHILNNTEFEYNFGHLYRITRNSKHWLVFCSFPAAIMKPYYANFHADSRSLPRTFPANHDGRPLSSRCSLHLPSSQLRTSYLIPYQAPVGHNLNWTEIHYSTANISQPTIIYKGQKVFCGLSSLSRPPHSTGWRRKRVPLIRNLPCSSVYHSPEVIFRTHHP